MISFLEILINSCPPISSKTNSSILSSLRVGLLRAIFSGVADFVAAVAAVVELATD